MSRAILELLGDEGRRAAYSKAGLARVAEKFTLRRQADAYLDWYAELTER
jgi:glycosyltransferase involved in cell wall biosynthesis